MEGAESMGSTNSNVGARQDAVWWRSGLMKIKARAEDTDGTLGLFEENFYREGAGPPLHVHSREDEAHYVLEGRFRFRLGDDEFVAGPGAWVWQPRGVPHSFKVETEGGRALCFYLPGGLERMFEEGGVPAGDSTEPPRQEAPDAAAEAEFGERFGFEVVGPQEEVIP
jgi:quercetin dioxygenase-like cupin family protein